MQTDRHREQGLQLLATATLKACPISRSIKWHSAAEFCNICIFILYCMKYKINAQINVKRCNCGWIALITQEYLKNKNCIAVNWWVSTYIVVLLTESHYDKQDWACSQQCCRGFRSYGTRRCVVSLIIPHQLLDTWRCRHHVSLNGHMSEDTRSTDNKLWCPALGSMSSMMSGIHSYPPPQNNLVCKLESSRETKVDFLQISKVVELRVFVFTHMFHISIIMPAQLVAANIIT